MWRMQKVHLFSATCACYTSCAVHIRATPAGHSEQSLLDIFFCVCVCCPKFVLYAKEFHHKTVAKSLRNIDCKFIKSCKRILSGVTS